MRCLQQGVLDHRVLRALSIGEGFIPKECELWDYKETSTSDRLGVAKTVRQIVSFHNTYGGYLVYGVKEKTADIRFVGVGITESLDVQQLRAQIENYTGVAIDITYTQLIDKVGEKQIVYGLLHIPKRLHEAHPIKFIRNGPERKAGQPLFVPDEIYMRRGDKCVPAKPPDDIVFLSRDRRLDSFVDDSESGRRAVGLSTRLPHNLPDSNFICPRFIGREQILGALWRWLADDFQYVRVLAGDGGKGKTSIAYEFAKQVAKESPYRFEQVIWLTAKQKQFLGLRDEYVDVPETHYQDLESLLRTIGSLIGLNDEELAGASSSGLKGVLKRNLPLIPSLIVVDDVDSVEVDEQKRTLEAAIQLGTAEVKFLLTTRANVSYSSDLSTCVPGLAWEEFESYLGSLEARLNLELPANTAWRRRLHDATGGSPLLTESIVRLVNQGVSAGDAIREWEGKAGEAARNAALQKEIYRLTPESRRVLLAAAFMGGGSLTELRQATGIEEETLSVSMEELQSLFLVSAPKILEKEPRFEVPSTTRAVVLQQKAALVHDCEALRKAVQRVRGGVPYQRRQGNRKLVGEAITQAHALFREHKYADALRTLEVALGRQKGQPDLLLAKGKLLLRSGRPNLEGARKTLREAYKTGQRKPLLYELWYEAEVEAGFGPGAIEVSSWAMEDGQEQPREWRRRRAYGYVLTGRGMERAGDLVGAFDHYERAADDLGAAVASSLGMEREERMEEARQLGDLMWKLAGRQPEKRWSQAFDAMTKAIGRGDWRASNFEKMLDALGELVAESQAIRDKGVVVGRIARARETLEGVGRDRLGKSAADRLGARLDGIQDRFSGLAGI